MNCDLSVSCVLLVLLSKPFKIQICYEGCSVIKRRDRMNKLHRDNNVYLSATESSVQN